MKKVKSIIMCLLLMFLFVSLPVQAAEEYNSNCTISESEISPLALITSVNVCKRSEGGNFDVEADIVTNDGTQKIIEIKNISLAMF